MRSAVLVALGRIDPRNAPVSRRDRTRIFKHVVMRDDRGLVTEMHLKTDGRRGGQRETRVRCGTLVVPKRPGYVRSGIRSGLGSAIGESIDATCRALC